jgi:hypothetical protein
MDNFSPLVWLPLLEGETKVRVSEVSVISGSLSGPGGGRLREDFKLTQTQLFVDTMLRLQLSRLSIRGTYAPRDFAATELFGVREVRLTYSGLTLGADLDFIQWNRTRVGVNFDYDLFSPQIYYPISLDRSLRIDGQNAGTVGFHVAYNPLTTLYGWSGMVEVRARWPVAGSQVTDWEIAAGMVSPTTVIGAMSLKGGYHNTSLNFRNQLDREVPALDVTYGGWFVELAYYY